MVPKIEDRACTIGGYCVGAVAEFDPSTLHLKVGPGIFKLNEQMERYEFPGAELDLPPDAVEVWMLRERATGKAVVGINTGQGVDDLTYEPIERIVHLERDGWCVVTWIPDLEQWGGIITDSTWWDDFMAGRPIQGFAKPNFAAIPDPEIVRGPDAPVVVFAEMPVHLKRALEIRNKAEEAAKAHRILRGKKWNDTEMETILRGILDRLESLDGLEVSSENW